tara:strand:- start:113 stop:727 length:615 start_codon:yes stop_codon:yes gene_type:complete
MFKKKLKGRAADEYFLSLIPKPDVTRLKELKQYMIDSLHKKLDSIEYTVNKDKLIAESAQDNFAVYPLDLSGKICTGDDSTIEIIGSFFKRPSAYYQFLGGCFPKINTRDLISNFVMTNFGPQVEYITEEEIDEFVDNISLSTIIDRNCNYYISNKNIVIYYNYNRTTDSTSFKVPSGKVLRIGGDYLALPKRALFDITNLVHI